MDQCTREVRAEYWRKIIQACGQRPAGQSAKRWMDENGIREQSYYHWQRRFRQQAYAEMKENVSVPVVTGKSELDFVEIPCTANSFECVLLDAKGNATSYSAYYSSLNTKLLNLKIIL